MKIKGKAFVFGENVNTDEIIPARYLSTSDHKELAKYCMEDLREGFGRRDDIAGGVFVAGENFGCGSSREHAPISIKAAGIQCVVAQSFARIYLRNSINIGLPIVELKDTSEFGENDEIEVDFDNGKIINHTAKKEYAMTPYPGFLQDIIQEGGWLNYAKSKLV
ncbi:MAG: 3-isopropylmalate dehydratase small subunit [bacterium]|nr:3-isopropylmalate dehydratase small subunit [bacterium]